jgi:M6 family metalloprotease-like protein
MKTKHILIFLIIISLLGLTSNLFAIPPHPNLVEKYRSDGKLDDLAAKLEEMKAVGMNRPFYDLEGRANQRAAPIKGINNVLVIRVGFSNVTFDPVSTNDFYKSLFEDGPNNDGYGWKQFYLDMSNGELELNFDVVNAGDAPNTHSYYGNDYSNVRDLVIWAVNQVDPTVDFSIYDNDNDGYVDGVVLIHAEPGEETSGVTGHIWSHRWSLASSMNVDGVKVYDYSMQPEYRYSPGDSTIGVFAHEYGHLLGLPDLYDTSYDTKGVGDWSLMSGGSWNGPYGSSGSRPAPLLSWEKDLLGWITIRSINPKQTLDETLTSSLNPDTEQWKDTLTHPSKPQVSLSIALLLLSGVMLLVFIPLFITKPGFRKHAAFLMVLLLVLTPVSITLYTCQPKIVLPTPTELTASDGTHTNIVHVSWDVVPGADEYTLFYSTSEEGNYQEVEQLILNEDLSANITGLDHNTTYWFKVKASNEEGYSELSEADDGSLGDIETNAIRLKDDTWEASSLIKGEEKWFYFDASSTIEYYVYWDDESEGSGYYTSNVNLTAYQEDLTTTYFEDKDSGYMNPVSVTPGATERVYIKVSGITIETKGTFSLKYNLTGESNGSFSLMEVEQSDEALKVVLGDGGTQYYLIENKATTLGSWAEYLPAEGLLICHIDDDFADSYEIAINSVNTGNVHGVSVKEADGDNNLWNGWGSSSGDTYNDPETLTPTTDPNTDLNSQTVQYGGGPSGISITNISSIGDVMSFDVSSSD